MQKGPSLTLRVMKYQAKRRPDRFKAMNSATSKLTLRVSVLRHFFTSLQIDFISSLLDAHKCSAANCHGLAELEKIPLIPGVFAGQGLRLAVLTGKLVTISQKWGIISAE
jgi:hypothetical protein